MQGYPYYTLVIDWALHLGNSLIGELNMSQDSPHMKL